MDAGCQRNSVSGWNQADHKPMRGGLLPTSELFLAEFLVRRVSSSIRTMTESQKLLRDYAQNGSEAAFRELVRRYVDLVFTTALRMHDQLGQGLLIVGCSLWVAHCWFD